MRRLPSVIPAKAGIQTFLISWIPGRASFRQLARNDDSLPFGVSTRLSPTVSGKGCLCAVFLGSEFLWSGAENSYMISRDYEIVSPDNLNDSFHN
jgi:hypothetical protein